MPIRPERISGENLHYVLVRSRRRTLSLIVHDDGTLEVRSPMRYPKQEIDRFIRGKAGWIERKRHANRDVVSVFAVLSAQCRQADSIIRKRFDELGQERGVGIPTSVKIRDQRSRWGSCSSRGAISLNRRCILLPQHLQDYVYLHELCHLRHMDHGADFWQLLEQQLPGARQRQRELNRYRLIKSANQSDRED